MMQPAYSSYKEICKKILKLDPQIRFAGIINNNGRLVTGAAKDKIKFYIDNKDREMLYIEVALRTRMFGEFNSCMGPMNFSIHHREFLITMEFPTENGTLFVSAEKKINLNEISFKIIETVRMCNTLYSITQ